MSSGLRQQVKQGQSLHVEAGVSGSFLLLPGPLDSAEGGRRLLRWAQLGTWAPEMGANTPEGICMLQVLRPL